MKKSRKIIGEEVKKLSINSPLIDMIFAIVIRLITKENYLKIEINFLHLFFVCVLKWKKCHSIVIQYDYIIEA